MLDNPGTLIWSILFSSIGVGYFMYGKRQRRGMALLAGTVLCIYPYFIANVFLLILIGLVLMALPYFIRA